MGKVPTGWRKAIPPGSVGVGQSLPGTECGGLTNKTCLQFLILCGLTTAGGGSNHHHTQNECEPRVDGNAFVVLKCYIKISLVASNGRS